MGIDTIFYSIFILWIACLLDFVPPDFFFAVCAAIVALAHRRIPGYQEHFYDIFFYYSRPYEVDDVIEFNPLSVTSSRPQKKRLWRVVRVHVFFTEITTLCGLDANHYFPSNKSLATRHILVWTRVPAIFQVAIQVDVDAIDGLLLLRELHEAIEWFANFNSNKWHPVKSFVEDAVTTENDYYDYRIDMEHRKTWGEYECASLVELILYCRKLKEKFIKSPVGRDAVAPFNGARHNNEKCGDDTKEVKSLEIRKYHDLDFRIFVV